MGSTLVVQRIKVKTRMETEKIREQSIANGEMDIAKTKAELDVLLVEGELDVAKNIAKGEKGMLQFHLCCHEILL